ncbi:MAG TPA: hypothetical protein VI653_21400, partial [Steroidobacteraceae bacterium]
MMLRLLPLVVVGLLGTAWATDAPVHKKKPAHKPPAVATAPAEPVEPADGATRLPAGRFGTVSVYIPEGTPQSVAIFLSGDGGWNLGV